MNLAIFWAKTDRAGKTSAYHPLPCHLVDVGMVALALWRHVLVPATRGGFTQGMGFETDDDTSSWVAFLAAIHDLGKLSPGFQLQDTIAAARLAAAGLSMPASCPRSLPHGAITTLTLPDVIPPEILISKGLSATLATVVGGHHGILPSAPLLDEIEDARAHSVGRAGWDAARRLLTRQIAELFGVLSVPPPLRIDNPTALALAGMVSVADWIGSNSDPEFFPFAVSDPSTPMPFDMRAYAEFAEERAVAALTRLGWSGWSTDRSVFSFKELFPDLPSARPVQREVALLADRLRGPSLVILEVPMGEGKTEAAMFLADRWETTGEQRGCYFALPTQATSNQMFGRVRDFLKHRYPKDRLDLQLLHGHAALSAEFEQLRNDGDRLFEARNVDGDPGADRAPAGVVASEWFTYRKRGLLAPYGVGTVDQCLLAVLQARHVFVRLFGLAHKTVIIDEVHAYDAYMSVLLDRLLEWLAALGSSVVLLSATLPGQRRVDLIQAYARGLGTVEDDTPPPDLREPYPRVTWVDATGSSETSVAVSKRATKVVRWLWVDAVVPTPGEPFALAKELRDALADGGCVAVIVNTVGRAQEIYRALRSFFASWVEDDALNLDLLHARFPFRERDEREKRTLARFGKPTDDEFKPTALGLPRPFRAILVATQIVEQSLDLDFDLIVSDLAPIDLLLQRLGRLWRHNRRNRRTSFREPTVWIGEVPSTDGVPRFEPGQERVYDPHVLLKSWLALQDAEDVLRVPEDVERLVEFVYAERDAPSTAKPALADRWEVTRQVRLDELAADQHEAKIRWLRAPAYSGAIWHFTGDPREEDAPGFHRAHQALTRLADPSVTLVCLFGNADQPYLDRALTEPIDLAQHPTITTTRRLLENSLTVADRRVIWTLLDEDAPSAWRNSSLLRHCRCRIFDSWNLAEIGKYMADLDPELGLRIRDRSGGWD